MSRLGEGIKHFNAEEYKEALSCFNDSLKAQCSKVEQNDILQRRARCHLYLGNVSHAIEDAKQLIENQPDSTAGHILHGKALTKAKKFEDALSAYRKGLDVDPNDKVIAQCLKDMQNAIVKSYEQKAKDKDMSYNAVNLCTQESYPGDEELAENERQIIELKGYNKLPCIYSGMPDPEQAHKYLQLARKEIKAGNLQSALKSYDVSLSRDPLNFDSWTEKAILLHQLERNGEAYQCVSAIPSECRNSDNWKLGGKILFDLDLHVTAEIWLRRATQMSQRKDLEAATLFQKIRVHRLYQPLVKDSKVKVDFTLYGRAVVAREDVKAGDIVLADRPAVFAQILEKDPVLACPNCAKSLMSAQDYFGSSNLKKNKTLKAAVTKYWPIVPRIPCSGCDKEIYCSETCREEAWSNYHEVLCPSVNPEANKLYDICQKIKELSEQRRKIWSASFCPTILARIWAAICCHAKRLAAENGSTTPTQMQWAIAKAPYRRFIAYGAQGVAGKFTVMHQVMKDVFNGLPEGLRYDVTPREFDGRYLQMACNVQSFSDGRNPLHCFLNSISNFSQYAQIADLVDVDNIPEANFAGVFPVQSCLNHSCANTIEVMDGVSKGRPGIHLRARINIKAGEELFSTYIDTSIPRRERRAWLFRGYNFWCQCPRCKFEGDGPDVCANCETQAPEGKQFPACGKCRKVWYCSPKCQKIAWKAGHKKICTAVSAVAPSPASI
ncbi:uncharacterized protein LOC115209940 isoform X2 [Octopus sinensis]|uniref:Uncharacterized protein LOC115209940 isoform X2 n=1 Tax=Octopus sinensis TaxID=2607531 RepID=A0A6P7S8M9_9MOLL|nr:uncharacterized protein LOC115209940 isoform X2 [Octopus sinensis]